MPDIRSLSDCTREQLYELVWSTPVTKLAEQFGVSDVAIAKHCRKLGVPRPARGYWAQLEFGKAVKKPELPPPPVSPAEMFAQEVQKPMASSITLSTETESLHPLAARFLTAVKSSALSYDKQRVHLREKDLPEAEISKAQAARAAGVFHGLLQTVESRGILFKRTQASYEGGYFKKGNDRLYLKIEEELVDKPETAGRRRAFYSIGQQNNKMPCGRLTLTLNPERYARQQEKRWSESEKMPIETIVAEMAKEICRYYADLQKKREVEAIEREKQRVESEIRWKKHEEEEAVRRREEGKRKHAEALEQTARTRQDDLMKSAEWWRIHRGAEDFIAECERRWRAAQAGELSPEQQTWLAWAHDVARGLSPFETGYPDLPKDGAFDPASVPFGGPYPEQRKFPQPPTMPEIPAPVVVQQGYGAATRAFSI